MVIAKDVAPEMRSASFSLDGESMLVRAIRPDDADRLQALHAHLSVDSIVHRFFTYLPTLPDDLANRFTHVDERNTMAFVATIGAGSSEQIIGVARYSRVGPHMAEIAFTVEDRWQGHGIATILLHRLAACARAQGYSALVALIMPNNIWMTQLVTGCGFPTTLRHEDGSIVVTLDISQALAQTPQA